MHIPTPLGVTQKLFALTYSHSARALPITGNEVLSVVLGTQDWNLIDGARPFLIEKIGCSPFRALHFQMNAKCQSSLWPTKIDLNQVSSGSATKL